MMSQKNKIAFIHIIGSLLFLSLPILFSPDISESFNLFKIKPFQRDFFSFALLLIFFYLNYFLFIPNFYFKKKYVVFAISILVSFIILSALPSFLFPPKHSNPEHFNHPIHQLPKPGFFLKFGEYLFRFIAVFTLSFMIKIYLRWKQTEKEKSDAELSYLKAQINPHFLFNTLNSIYSLSIEEKAHKTSNSIIELSKMMRYVLNDSHQEYVSLEKEINYIKSFIELQKVRLGNTINLNYKIEGEITGKKIAPIILIPFIENAFKHGINPEENSKIKIEISVSENQIHLLVVNDKVKIQTKTTEQSGIGIENTKNRLSLLYPNKHQIIISDTEKNYSVSLSIKIND